jgi:membrane-bound lytic murein transglycosylase D
VRPGDTLSGIATRHGVAPDEILALNRLASRDQLRAGQTLLLPADSAAAAPPVEIARATVAPPEPAPEAPAPAEVATQGATPTGSPIAPSPTTAAPGQAVPAPAQAVAPPVAEGGEPSAPVVALVESLAASTPSSAPAAEVPGLGEASPESSAAAAPANAPAKPVSPPAEVTTGSEPPAAPTRAAEAAPARVAASGSDAAPLRPDVARLAVDSDETIRVAPEETLGHYADWLALPTSQLRALNGLRSDTALALGKRVRLDFGRVSREAFEQRRLAFHRSLHDDFFRSHRVAGTDDYVLERGDTLWVLSQRKLSVPVWLLHAYNPEVDFAAPLRVGQVLRVPRLAPRDA